MKKQGYLPTSWEAIPEAKRAEVLGEYVRDFFEERFGSDNLEKLRDEALKAALTAHGAKLGKESGPIELQKLSQRNLERLIGKSGYRSNSDMRDAETVVGSLGMRFNHFSNSLAGESDEAKRLPNIPLIASRQLEALGLPGGMASRPFNKELLGSDNNVFFSVVPGNKDLLYSEYGFKLVVLDDSYAMKHGWISPFVMYEQELRDVMKVCCPEFVNNHAREFERLVFQEDWQVWEAARNRLHEFDFTVPDFKRLIESKMLTALGELKKSNAARYRQVSSDLRRGKDIGGYLDEFVFKPSGLPSYFEYELKVPVAVPSSALSLRAQRPW